MRKVLYKTLSWPKKDKLTN